MQILTLDLLAVIISLVGLAGNGIVLQLLTFQIQRTAFYVYILNLAASDFLFLTVQFLFHLGRLIGDLELIAISIRRIAIITKNFAYITGLSILSVISTERCVSVLCPLWHRFHRPQHMSAVMCALLWTLSLLLTILHENYCHSTFGNCDRNSCMQNDIIIAVWLILSFVLLSGSSLALLIGLLCGSQQIKLTRLYMTLGLTVLVFLLCGLPWGIHWFLLFWFLEGSPMLPNDFIEAAKVLTCVNSCANPIIYFFVGSYRKWHTRSRQALRLVLQRAFEDIPEVEGSEGSAPQGILEMSGNSQIS
ncbi:mas-related G-protein coupled receptor member X2-like [Sorex fumeus]|uniref:mas-related G-protein coupled receptor member X2-like n=1 Tax=Sorex fumeus TaxID=62283 RepID=UPI0024AE27C7|nr:mas-related G-protein coupled receptor member X2-like [Sorex fumeus]